MMLVACGWADAATAMVTVVAAAGAGAVLIIQALRSNPPWKPPDELEEAP